MLRLGSLLALALALSLPHVSRGEPRGALAIRVVREGVAVPGIVVALERQATGWRAEVRTNERGVATFTGLVPGSYLLSLAPFVRRVALSPETDTLVVDLGAPGVPGGRFGRSDLTGDELEALPNAGTVSSVLETIEPFAVTDRVDVAGIESATEARWSVRGSSWTQNRVLLDGADVTDPSGGTPLLYPDVAFFEEVTLATSANAASAAGTGGELHLVTRPIPGTLQGTFAVRYSGRALQSENLTPRLRQLGVEPRALLRFPSGRVEAGGARFYGALHGFDLERRVPNFDAEERTSLLDVTAKTLGERFSLLGVAQRWSRPTLGARPGMAPEATVDGVETFRVAVGSLRAEPFDVRFGYARAELSSRFSGAGSPLRDLASSTVAGAPPLVADRVRSRWTARATFAPALPGHLLRVGAELSRGAEDVRERVPGDRERLSVDGTAHAVSLFSGSIERSAAVTRLALHLEEALFVDFLGRPWRLAPGLRLDASRSGPVRWTSLSGAARAGVLVTPSAELHFSLGRYPHALTTRIQAAQEGLSWIRYRWTDEDGDGEVSREEIGSPLRRGGGEYTSIAEGLPRPVTDELTVGVEKRFRRGFLRFGGYQRWERRLLQTTNLGIATAKYRSFPFLDVGVDGILGTGDDGELTIFDQRDGLGEDRFLVTHPPGLGSFAQGVDLLIGLERGRFSFRLAGRAYRDVGTTGVGNDATENDTGILGGALDDPNSLTNAEGRLFFDRAFTGKLALTAKGPRDIRIGVAIRYWDGQPFARHLFFPELGQGFLLVQALPRGRQRYAFNMTADVRVEREIRWGRTRIGLALDVFNLFNQSLHTAEVVRSGERFRDPTLAQPARTIVLGGRVRFGGPNDEREDEGR